MNAIANQPQSAAAALPTSGGRWGIVTGDFVPTGGMDVANLHLARWLAERGPVELVSHRVDASLAELQRVTAHLAARPFGRHLLGEGKLRSEGRRVARDVLAAGGRFIANGGNCDAGDVNWVHYVHAAYEPTHATSLPRRLKGIVHRRESLRRERAALRAARVVVCNSQLTARHAVELVGAPIDRVATVYYGADAERFPLTTPALREDARRAVGADSRPWLVFLGALGDRRKGFDTLYDAWREVSRDAGWDAVLAVVGRGAEAPRWLARAKADGLDRSTRFLGFRDDVPRVLAAAEGIVHPARYEAYGLGVHEAVVTGLPAIVTANCGVAERLTETDLPTELADLLLPSAGDAAALAGALRRWRDRLDDWPTLVRPVAERLRSYTWDDMARDFVAAVERVSGGGA